MVWQRDTVSSNLVRGTRTQRLVKLRSSSRHKLPIPHPRSICSRLRANSDIFFDCRLATIITSWHESMANGGRATREIADEIDLQVVGKGAVLAQPDPSLSYHPSESAVPSVHSKGMSQ